MRRKLVRGLAIGALLLAMGTTVPAPSAFAGQGGGGGPLHVGECSFQDNLDGTFTVWIGMGPADRLTGLATRQQVIVTHHQPDNCRLGGLTPKVMDPIPFDSDDAGSGN